MVIKPSEWCAKKLKVNETGLTEFRVDIIKKEVNLDIQPKGYVG